MSDRKICTDCKHYVFSPWRVSMTRFCSHPLGRDLTGDFIPLPLMRAATGECGTDGKLYVPVDSSSTAHSDG